MRIVRYPLEIVDYQQLQPLWPGRVLSVAPGRPESITHRGKPADMVPAGAFPMLDPVTGETVYVSPAEQKIDMWCIDDNTNRAGRPPPLLGVWIVGTGYPMPDGLLDNDTGIFHGTCVMANCLVWHVFSTAEGTAPEADAPLGEVSSVDELVDKIKAKHAHRRQP